MRRVLIGLVVLVIALPVMFLGTLYLTAWANRLDARRLLSAAYQMQPGTTTQNSFETAMQPFQKYKGHGTESSSGKSDVAFDFYRIPNYPKWLESAARHVPERVDDWMFHHVVLPATGFSISPRFADGMLSKLEIGEEQDGIDGIHPFLAEVTFYEQARESTDWRFEGRSTEFAGYSVEQITETLEGIRNSPTWTIREYVLLDERATVSERQQSLNFQLRCFTSFHGCKDAELLLKPAANR